jgi:beta-barrel assembly-enhancing protease
VRTVRALGLVLLAILGATACASSLPSIGREGAAFTPEADEQRLWAQGDREAKAIGERVRLHDDPELGGYLSRLVERLTPPALRVPGAPRLRVAVLRDPTLAVFALPGGDVLVTTGALASVQNEAQLALLLAREIAHVAGRHALAVQRESGLPSARAGGLGVFGPTAAAIIATDARLATLAARPGYGESRERDADVFALEAITRAGWDARAGIEVYAALAREGGERGRLETLALGAPLTLRERLTSLRKLVSVRGVPLGAGRSTDEFETRRLAVMLGDAAENVRAGRFALARRQLDRVLSATPDQARAHLLDGDWHRLQAQRSRSDDERRSELGRAQEAYERAVSLDPALAAAHRQLGLLYFQGRDMARAVAEFESYVARAGDAADAARVGEYARELAR